MKRGYLHCLKDALGSVVLIISSSCSDLAAHPASVSASPGEREGTKLPTPHRTLEMEILAVSHSNKHVAQGLNAFTLDCLAGIPQLSVEESEEDGAPTVTLTVVKSEPPLSFPFSTDAFCRHCAHHRIAAGA